MGEYDYDNIEQLLELPELDEWEYSELEDGHRLERSGQNKYVVEWENKDGEADPDLSDEGDVEIYFIGKDVNPNSGTLADRKLLDSSVIFEVLRFVRAVNVWYDETEKYEY